MKGMKNTKSKMCLECIPLMRLPSITIGVPSVGWGAEAKPIGLLEGFDGLASLDPSYGPAATFTLKSMTTRPISYRDD
jgi:hypothetical protein